MNDRKTPRDEESNMSTQPHIVSHEGADSEEQASQNIAAASAQTVTNFHIHLPTNGASAEQTEEAAMKNNGTDEEAPIASEELSDEEKEAAAKEEKRKKRNARARQRRADAKKQREEEEAAANEKNEDEVITETAPATNTEAPQATEVVEPVQNTTPESVETEEPASPENIQGGNSNDNGGGGNNDEAGDQSEDEDSGEPDDAATDTENIDFDQFGLLDGVSGKEQTAYQGLRTKAKSNEDKNLKAFLDVVEEFIRKANDSTTPLSSSDIEHCATELQNIFTLHKGKFDIALDSRESEKLREMQVLISMVLHRKFPDENSWKYGMEHVANMTRYIFNGTIRNLFGNNVKKSLEFGVDENRKKINSVLDDVKDARMTRRNFLKVSTGTVAGIAIGAPIGAKYFGGIEVAAHPDFEIQSIGERKIAVEFSTPDSPDLTINKNLMFYIGESSERMEFEPLSVGNNVINVGDHLLPKGGTLKCTLLNTTSGKSTEKSVKIDALQ